jgi:hypothetical protein
METERRVTEDRLFEYKPIPRTAGEVRGEARGARLRVGVRVRMSALGQERHPKYGAREGVVVGRGSPRSWRVKFDERVTVQAIFDGYLEVVPGPNPVESAGPPTRPRPGNRS